MEIDLKVRIDEGKSAEARINGIKACKRIRRVSMMGKASRREGVQGAQFRKLISIAVSYRTRESMTKQHIKNVFTHQ